MSELNPVSWKEVKAICESMYLNNIYQTPYQSWEFLNIVGKGFQLKRPLDGIQFTEKTLVYLNSGKVRCVLPIEIDRIKKRIRMRGYCSSIGHLDFIYPSDFTKAEYDDMLILLSDRFNGYTFEFDRISERSLTYTFSIDDGIEKEESECVLIPLVETWENWIQNSVGSRTRKNIRKAYRELEQDGYKIRLEIFNEGKPIDIATWDLICDLFAERSCVHNSLNPKYFHSIVKLIKANDPIGRALHYSKYSMITALYFNNSLVAFGCGVKSNDGRFISMRHGVNMDYKNYQIGLIYTSEVVKKLIENREVYAIKEFDRSRGAEQHKLGVGGIIHKNFHWLRQFS